MYTFTKHLIAYSTVAVVAVLVSVAQAQVLDKWVRVNEGFAKCAKIGESAGEAEWYRDNFEVKQMIWRKGEMYAHIAYRTNPSVLVDKVTPHPEFNYLNCSGGMFRHDTILMQWVKVAEAPPRGSDAGRLTTNRSEIFQVYDGYVFQLTFDYAAYPTGWKKISKAPHDPLQVGHFTSNCGCFNSACDWAPKVESRPVDAIGDTIYVYLGTGGTGTCPDRKENYVGKFSVVSGTWTFDFVGGNPVQLWKEQAPATFGTEPNGQFYHFTFVDRIGGLFKYFWTIDSWGANTFIPRAHWVFDPRDGKWKNISKGPEYNNFTGSSCNNAPCSTCKGLPDGSPGCNDSVDVNAGWATGYLKASWDRKSLYMGTQQGTFKWDGDKWFWMGDNSQGSPTLFTNNGAYTKGYYGSGPVIKSTYDGLYQIVGGRDELFYCHHNKVNNLYTPNDGRTLYVELNGMKDPNICDWNGVSADIGIFRIFPDPNKPSPVTNLHLQTATYLGAPADNKPVNLGIAGNNDIFVAGNFDDVQAVTVPGAIVGAVNNTLFGATPAQRGKLIRLNNLGDTIRSAVTLGNLIYDFEIQNYGQKKMVVSGDFGVAVLDSNGGVLWRKDLPEVITDLGVTAPYTHHPYPIVDIDDIGRVVMAMGRNFHHRYRVADVDGSWTGASSSMFGGGITQEFVEDVAISGNMVYFSGFNNGNLFNPAACIGPSLSGLAVQSSWVKAHNWTQPVASRYSHKTYGYKGEDLILDQADTRAYRINIGADGKLYYLGEAAGGNSVYRWKGRDNDNINLNGCANPQGALVTFDPYNLPINTSAAHLAFYATIDPLTGEVERGQYVIPRLDNMRSNSFRIRDGYVHADEQGYVYVAGASSYKFAGRLTNTINGKLIGDYTGDMSILIVSPDYLSRTYWGAFGDSLGSGTLKGVGLRGNIISVLGEANYGTMYTGASHWLPDPTSNCHKVFSAENALNNEPFNPNWVGPKTNTDAYLAVWFQDVWNYARCGADSMERRRFPSCPIIDTAALTSRANFDVSPKTVCVGQSVTITNTSKDDSTGHTWNFGVDASLLPGTKGVGPFSVSYSSPGFKNVRLDVILTRNRPTYHELDADQRINVMPNTSVLTPVVGPDTVCSGAEVIFSVNTLEGATYYTWEVPVGSSIIDGQGGPKIRCVLGASSGVVRVRATYPCGTTPWSSKNVVINGPTPFTALIVTGEAGPTAGDEAMKTQLLTSSGLNQVLFMSDKAISGSNAECMGLVIISNSADTNNLEFKLRQLRTPVIVTNPYVLGYMGMTNGASFDRNREPAQQNIELIDNTHEVGQINSPLGSVNMYSTNLTIGWGVPSANADVIASVVGDPSRAAIFTYEQGAAMRGYDAPDRRVFFFMDQNALLNKGSRIDTSFSRAVCWALRNCPTTRSITTMPVNNQYCFGDSIKIPFTATGTFSGLVPNKLDPANTIVVDNSQEGVLNSDATVKFFRGGTWNSIPGDGGAPLPIGTDLLSSRSTAFRRAIYRPELPYRGRYEVRINVPSTGYTGANTPATGAEVIVTHEGGSNTFFINQSIPGVKVLGPFTFPMGPGAIVEINNNNNTNVMILADAITFVPDTLFPVGNIFTAQLSNAFGNFSTAINLGQIQNNVSDTIRGVLPAVIASGSGYRVRVVSTQPSVVGSDTGFVGSETFSIIGVPDKPLPIDGPEVACQNAGGMVYSIPPVAGATSYVWTRPTGSVWEGGPTSITFETGTSVTVNFGTSTGGEIRVQSRNSCGVSNPINGFASKNVTITGFPPPTPAPIGGELIACTGKQYTYVVPPVFSATSYKWTVSGGVTIVGSDSSNSVTVSYTTQGNKILTVEAIGACGTSPQRSITVNVNNALAAPVLGPISVANGVCAGEFVYSVTPITGAISYTWGYPAINTLGDSVSGNVSRVTYSGPTTGNITVFVTDACGVSPTQTLPVNITTDTSALKVNLGPDIPNACGAIVLNPGVWSAYNWTTGATTQFLTVTTPGTYGVTITDIFGCSTYDEITINTSSVPGPALSDTTILLNAACGVSDVYLKASGSTGIYRWYQDAVGGSPLDSAAQFLAKAIDRDTAFYVSAWEYGSPQFSHSIANPRSSATIGTSATVSYVTREIWFKTASTNVDMIMIQDDARGLRMSTFGCGVGHVGFRMNTSAGEFTLCSPTALNDDAWHHVASVYNDGKALLYIDGVAVDSINMGAGATLTLCQTNRCKVGVNETGGTNPFIGSMTSFRNWSRALSAAEIMANKNKCVPLSSFGLVNYFKFDDAANTFKDEKGNYTGGSTVGTITAATGPQIACGVCESSRDTLNVFISPLSNTLTTQDYVVCDPPQNITVTASGATGKYRWYNAPVAGTLLDSSSAYTSSISANTVYYVSSWDLGLPTASSALQTNGSSGGSSGNIYCVSSGSALTWETQFKTTSANPDMILIQDDGRGLRLNRSASCGIGRISWVLRTNPGDIDITLCSKNILNDGAWHHVAAVYDAGVATLYIDGVADTSVTQGTTYAFTNTARCRVGVSHSAGSNRFVGEIDEVRVWDVARTASQIAENSVKCLNGAETGLKNYLRFGDNATGCWDDVMGNYTSGGSGACNAAAGPVLSCSLCESPRQAVNITVETDPLATGTLAKANYCPGETLNVPIAICGNYASTFCPADDDSTSLVFGGSNQWVTATGYKGILGSNSRTVELWFKTANSTAATRDLFSYGSAAERFVIRTSSTGKLRFELSSGNYIESSANVYNAAWHHVAIVVPATGTPTLADVQMYVNGVLQAVTLTGAGTTPVNTVSDQDVRIARASITGGANFQGNIDEVRIWSEALSAADINARRFKKLLGNEPNLEFYYTFANGSGTDVTDQSGNGRHGVTSGTPTWQKSGAATPLQKQFPYDYIIQFDDNAAFSSPINLDTISNAASNVCVALNDVLVTSMPYPLPVSTGYRVRVVARRTDGGATITGVTSPTTITVPTNTWTGAVSTDWHNNGNWSCQIPDSTLNAIIPNVTNKPEILSGTAMAKQVTIAASSSLTLSPGATLGVWDHITNSGTFTAGANSTLALNRSDAAQTMTGISSLSNLVVNNPMGVSMSAATLTMDGSLSFQRGSFDLSGNKTVDLCSGSGAVTGGSATSHFIMDDNNLANGFLKVSVRGDGNDFMFPVGTNGTYNPAIISNTGTDACFEVRVFGSVHVNGLTGTTLTDNFVNRTWEITPSVPTGHNANITLQWTAANEQGTFDRNNCFVAKNRGVSGDNLYLQAGPQGTAVGPDPYTAQAIDVITFSKFAVTSDPQFLPIDLLSFKGKNVEGNALLEWSTGYEASCATYYIEKSTDGGESFQTIGEVACKNSPSGAEYTYVDRLLTQNSWYRLRQVDVDGQTTLSNIILVRVSALAASAFSLSPNPSTDRVKLSYGAELTEWDEVDMKVTTMQGVEVVKMSAGLSTLNKELNRQLKHLAGGMYIISLEFNDEKQHIKWTVLK